ncbi:Cysteine dioxygenase [Oopsacas minuta]|uniref:Cysteine dioxygenase n=1 Tax=Oopsacas minuta TaxID=111878 RepID=A0AAV7KTW9_9METZ|nr:Cysteine dioxygenase [Oopsacas minuta]
MLSVFALLRYYATRPAARFLAHDMDSSSFSLLVRKLRETVGNRGDVEEIKSLLSDYKAVRSEYSKYITWNDSKYTRNLIDQGNGLFNLMTMCWGPGQTAPIHSHPGANCYVRMLEGKMEEQLYTKPIGPGARVELQRSRVLNTGDVIHLRDDISIHSMTNVSSQGAVTLHLYSPPYTASEIFNEDTGDVIRAPIMYTTKGAELQPQPEGITL